MLPRQRLPSGRKFAEKRFKKCFPTRANPAFKGIARFLHGMDYERRRGGPIRFPRMHLLPPPTSSEQTSTFAEAAFQCIFICIPESDRRKNANNSEYR
jgi:hypothetical protein